MPRPFRFTVQGGTHLEGPDAILGDAAGLPAHARRIEELGYQEFYSYDHMGAVDPFAPLLIAAAATERLRVGPLVLNNELHHPALLARTAATVDRLTGGRLILGIGTGYDEAEHESIGSPIRRPGPRVDRLGESLEVLRALLDKGSVDFDGEHHHIHVADLGVRPVQDRVPFLIGGQGRRVVSLAGRYADIFQFTGLTHGVGGQPALGAFTVPDVVPVAARLSEAAGDRDADIERSALVQVLGIGGGGASAEDVATRFGLDPEAIRNTPFALFGSIEQVVDLLERIRELIGISHYVIRDPENFAPVAQALTGS